MPSRSFGCRVESSVSGYFPQNTNTFVLCPAWHSGHDQQRGVWLCVHVAQACIIKHTNIGDGNQQTNDMNDKTAATTTTTTTAAATPDERIFPTTTHDSCRLFVRCDKMPTVSLALGGIIWVFVFLILVESRCALLLLVVLRQRCVGSCAVFGYLSWGDFFCLSCVSFCVDVITVAYCLSYYGRRQCPKNNVNIIWVLVVWVRENFIELKL